MSTEKHDGTPKLPDDHILTLRYLAASGRLGIYTEHLIKCYEELVERRQKDNM